MKRLLSAGIILLAIGSAQAKSPGAAFLTLPHSVRSEGAGGCAGLAEGAEALGMNPALITPLTSQGQIYTSFAQLWEDTAYAHLAGAWRLNKRHTGLALALSTVKTDGNGDRNAQGALTGTTADSQDTTAMAGISLRPAAAWRTGATARVFRSEIGPDKSEIGWSTDWGVAWAANKSLVAFSINHLGPGQQFLNQRDSLPTSAQLDGSWTTKNFTWAARAGREIAAKRNRLSGGVEYRWGPLAFRSGVNVQGGGEDGSIDESSTEEWVSGLSAGVGFQAGKSWRFDYAVRQPSSHFDAVHRAALTWSWGPPAQSWTARPVKSKPSQKQKSPPSRLRLSVPR